MAWIKKKLYLAAIPISLALSIVSSVSVRANSATEFLGGQQNRTWKISQAFKDETPNRGANTRTAGGATRGGCAETKRRLTPLMPQGKLGLTLKERPTFFWHTSESEGKTAEFFLLDDNLDDDKENLIYKTTFNLPKKQGIFAFTLPADAPGLKVDKEYHWYLSVNCSLEETDDMMTVEGKVKRTSDINVTINLDDFDPKYPSTVYADAGLWHETISHVAEQLCISRKEEKDPKIESYWDELLTSVGLREFVSESINYSCKFES